MKHEYHQFENRHQVHCRAVCLSDSHSRLVISLVHSPPFVLPVQSLPHTQRRIAQTADCVEKHLHLTFQDERGLITLGGLSVVRKFSDPHRTVFVLTTRIHCSEHGVQLREDSWLVVSDGDDNNESHPTARFQRFHRTYVGRASRARATPALRELQDFVARSASARMHEHQMLMLRLLSEEFGSTAAAGIASGAPQRPQLQLAAV